MTVWYDLTTSLRNSGHNGIANVEWSIGQALMQADIDVRPFAMIDDRLVVLTEDDLRAAFYAAESSPSAKPIGAGRATAVARVLSERFGPRGYTIVRDGFSLGLQGARVGRSAIRRVRRVRQRPSLRTGLASVLNASDVVVSLGADWEGHLARQLQAVRKEVGCRVATMVYDLIPLTHPHLAFHKDAALFSSYYEALIAASDLTFCISEESERQLVLFAAEHGLALRSTAVLRLGDAVEAPDTSYTEVPDRDFYLWVGTIERRKNLEVLYDALRILDADGHELPTIVVVGSTGWGTYDLLHEIGLMSTEASRHMLLVGSVRTGDLDRLYSSARALLFPSFYEGWGLPIREAAIRGLPVAAGDSPAAREAASGYSGVSLIDPDNPEDWAEYLRTQSAVPRGAGRMAPVPAFLWSDSADELASALAGRGWIPTTETMVHQSDIGAQAVAATQGETKGVRVGNG